MLTSFYISSLRECVIHLRLQELEQKEAYYQFVLCSSNPQYSSPGKKKRSNFKNVSL